ncbi:unnamed protein product [Kuraishia capsulata CBS 1993]|uniref:Uncharacterized protein n=1 Tax=Kuraishia capsulata CBS 1993 TaxID=1382522 RepID=W6MJ44_9ASCO|nr:uncharacterized protein KUCA_T00002217001 [Kuraishia capsulata CBS 1993]CDK26246.1 unnamed protein product [Kuraishia capsulata CBS 1993]
MYTVLLFLIFTSASMATAWDVVPSNITRQYGYINVLRCINHNVGDDITAVAVNTQGLLGLYHDMNSTSSRRTSYMINKCRHTFNASLAIYEASNRYAEDEMLYYGGIDELLYGHKTLDSLIAMGRDDDLTSGTDADLIKEERYPDLYEMPISQTTGSCSSYEAFHTYADLCQDDQKNPFYAFGTSLVSRYFTWM